MANVDHHPLPQGSGDENNVPVQRDDQPPKPPEQERQIATPAASQRTPDAQYPLDGQIPHQGKRVKTAAGFHAIFETMLFTAREGIARTVRGLYAVSKKGGFDCPSCAWPDPDGKRHPAEFCENGAKAVAWEVTDKLVEPEFFARHSVAELAAHNEQWLGDQGRIVHPMVLARGSQHYEPIAWADAFRMIADELNKLASPDEAMFYTSGRASNEAAFMYQLFVRQFGTNNLPDCSNMCHESSGLGLNRSIGIGKGTVTLGDFDLADCIFIIGQNPGTNHPRMLAALESAAQRGCKIISINPLAETGMLRFKHPQKPIEMLGRGKQIASLFLPVRINGDMAVVKGIMKEMLALDEQSGGQVLDRQFIAEKTAGFDAFVADLHATGWDEIVEQSGVSRELIRQAAEIAARCERMITCWAMGLTQHKNAVGNVQTIANFNLMRGQIGRPGAGVCPVRGHSNVQGDRTMGIWEKMSDTFMHALGKEFNFAPPPKHGCDVVDGLQAMHEGRVKVFVGLGGNMLSAGPDTEYAADAFRRATLSVQISTKLNRNHLVTGEQALILPCLGRTERDMQAGGEQFVSCENSMGVVQQSRGILSPASPHLMSETAIVCRMAHATLAGRSTVDWIGLCGDYDRIRQHIENVIPGFNDYNRRVRESGGFYLPNPPRDSCEFRTENGKANFAVHPIPRIPLAPGQLLMMSLRSHDQFNTTIYGENDRYRGVFGGRRVIFLNREDMDELGLAEGQWVDITSHFEGERRTVRQFMVVPYEIPPRCAATYYPETNPLAPLRSVAEGSNQPAYKSIVITLEPAAEPVAHSRVGSRMDSATPKPAEPTEPASPAVCQNMARVSVEKVNGRSRCAGDDVMAVEEPLEIRLAFVHESKLQQKSISITMRTPGHDFDLACGFLLTEGIIRGPQDIGGVRHCAPAVGPLKLRNTVRVQLRPEVPIDFDRLQRHFYTSSSCGVCGKTSIAALTVAGVAPLPADGLQVSADAFHRLPEELRRRQDVFDQTGGLHAAALFDPDGRLIVLREDVGRHNAVDKLIGSELVAGRLPLERRILLVSGRASFELVQKALVARIPIMAAVGAPSSLAVELAGQNGMTLLGFLRSGRFNIYCGGQRVLGPTDA